MNNEANKLMVEGYHPDISNYFQRSSQSLVPAGKEPKNLLEQYIFNNSYHSPLHDLMETYLPWGFQLEYEVCPDIIPNSLNYAKEHPAEYERLAFLHKAGKAAANLYAMHIFQKEHPAAYLDWSNSGLSLSDYAKQKEKQS